MKQIKLFLAIVAMLFCLGSCCDEHSEGGNTGDNSLKLFLTNTTTVNPL